MTPHDEIRSSLDSASLARSITRWASRHTFLTICLLVDHEHIADAFRAYAYFRWVDDQIDLVQTSPAERAGFLSRQSALIESAYHEEEPDGATPAECMVIDLIRGDSSRESGLACYIRNMMDVMAFDASRRGRTITQSELDAYTRSLAVAVSEASVAAPSPARRALARRRWRCRSSSPPDHRPYATFARPGLRRPDRRTSATRPG